LVNCDDRVDDSPGKLVVLKTHLLIFHISISPFLTSTFRFHNTTKRSSGDSVNEYLPKILGVLKSLRKELMTIFQFSNKVVETSFETLLKGNIRTTFGTDFNCIAQSIIERGFDKAVIITDGYASMSAEFKQQLTRQGLVTLTILFDTAQTCQHFAGFGDVLLLEDVTT